MKWIKRLFGIKEKTTPINFESVWVSENVYDTYDASKILSDEAYIFYHIWKERHSKEMYEKYLPKITGFRGKHSNIIFHGGCINCISQQIHGINRCKGCQYFRAEWSKPDLSICVD